VTPTIAFGTTSNTNQAFLRLQSTGVGAAASGVVTVRNAGATGTPSLSIANVQLAAGSPTFAITQDNCTGATVAPGGNCTVNVSYTPPDVAVPHNGNIVVTSNGRTTAGVDGPHSVALEGTILIAGSGNTTANAPNAPSGMRFQNTPVNALSAQIERISVVNTGAAALTVQARLGLAQSDFSVVNGCISIAVGNSCFVDVRFRPRGEGTRSDTLTLTYNGGSLPTIALSGTGQAASTAGQGAGGGALPLPWLLLLAAGMLAAIRQRRRQP
jgi:MYXO-CTERM domain-containing protein